MRGIAVALLAAVPCLGQVTGPTALEGLKYGAEFFPGATYDESVPTPEAVLGFPVGERAATHDEIEAVMKAIASKSARCRLVEYGKTHEGRRLWYLVIGTPERVKDLEGLKSDFAALADPRKRDAADVDALVEKGPALAWMAYCIHGDETSGSDAALSVAHYLAASRDPAALDLLSQVVVIIDPSMNPDGRDRFLAMIAQNRTAQPNVDDQSLTHTGFWPRGRMNHYLFDMNRDWIFGTQPETRGRIAAISEWHPQYFMESHEMGSQDTFLFMPGREAINPNMPSNVAAWERRFADDLAGAFDERGWRYYTGEWNDNWYPGYSSSWAAMRGMVENLYEQANISSDAVRRREGSLEAYREAVHKQLVATMANLRTLAKNRRAVLADYVAQRRRAVGEGEAVRTFAFPPGGNAGRRGRLLDLLRLQGFEAGVTTGEFSRTGKDRLGRVVEGRVFPAGTVVVTTRQPLGSLVSAMLEFDPRMTGAFLTDERREILRFDRSLIYDITGWSIPMVFDVECYELKGDAPEGTAALKEEPPRAAVVGANTTVAYVIDGTDDASVAAAGRLMERGVRVRVADKAFQFGGYDFARGSVVVTRVDNRALGGLDGVVSEVCGAGRVQAVGVTTGQGPGDLPDLGGEHFVLLEAPKIAVMGREPFGPYSYGQAWYVIDHVLGLRASYVDADRIGGADLRRYNVIVLPDGGGGRVFEKHAEDLGAWVRGGGTLIAIGGTAAAIASEKHGLSGTRRLPDVLAKPEAYIQAVIREWEGRNQAAVESSVWSFTPPSGDGATAFPWDGAAGEKVEEEEAKRRDSWRRMFMPAGAILAGRVDDRSWLTSGCGEYVPVMALGDEVLVTPPGVQAPVRYGYFAPAAEVPEEPKAETASAGASATAAEGDKGGETGGAGVAAEKKKEEKPKPGWMIAPKGQELRLRMSGLLWPEAAERIANTAYVTREGVGAGQVILFASDPNFRATTLGTSRIFQNAVVYGPGMGAGSAIELRHHDVRREK